MGSQTSVLNVVTSAIVKQVTNYVSNNKTSCIYSQNLLNLLEIEGRNIKISGNITMENKGKL